MVVNKYGITDLPVMNGVNDSSGDQLDIDAYYIGLSQFIMLCETPMTIAVQGDWGSGKTSTMNLVQDKIVRKSGEKFKIINFNTWQYSQFNLGEALVFSMLDSIVRGLTDSSTEKLSNELKEKLRQAGKFLFGASLSLLKFYGDQATGGAASKAIDGGIGQLNSSPIDQVSDIAEQLVELKKTFQDLVNQYCSENHADRVIIFIDDLDRLDPPKAVEIMECLKLFLDCTKCVFVLAIDFDIVARGVSAKYGEDLDERKARSFFDKIIQVPFMMPVNAYKIDSLLKNQFDAMEIKIKEENLSDYVTAAQYSVGNNPRSIKRLLNTFVLLRLINSTQNEEDPLAGKENLITFMLLCAQSAYPIFHDKLVKSYAFSSEDNDFLNKIFNDEIEEESRGRYGLEVYEINSFNAFVNKFRYAILDVNKKLDRDLLGKCIDVSQVTAVGVGAHQISGVRGDVSSESSVVKERVESVCSPEISELVYYIRDKYKNTFSGREVILAAQDKKSRAVNIYVSGTKNKVVEIGLGKTSLQARFGMKRKQANSLGKENHLNQIEQNILKKYDNKKDGKFYPSAGKSYFFSNDMSLPFRISGITSKEDVDYIFSFLRDWAELKLEISAN